MTQKQSFPSKSQTTPDIDINIPDYDKRQTVISNTNFGNNLLQGNKQHGQLFVHKQMDGWTGGKEMLPTNDTSATESG